MPELTAYTSETPTNTNEADGESQRALATVEQSTVDTFIVGIRWFTPLTLPTSATLAVWSLTGDDPASDTGTRLITPLSLTMTPGAWCRANLAAPLAWPANTPRAAQVAIVGTGARYVYSPPDTFPITNGTLSALGEEVSGNGRWTNGGTEDSLAENQSPGSEGYNFFVELITDIAPPTGHSKGAEFMPFF